MAKRHILNLTDEQQDTLHKLRDKEFPNSDTSLVS